MQSPIQWEEPLGQGARGDRPTGGRKTVREEAAGPSEKSREAEVNKVTAWRAPAGMVKTTLFEVQS
jgi:hypothetical protein